MNFYQQQWLTSTIRYVRILSISWINFFLYIFSQTPFRHDLIWMTTYICSVTWVKTSALFKLNNEFHCFKSLLKFVCSFAGILLFFISFSHFCCENGGKNSIRHLNTMIPCTVNGLILRKNALQIWKLWFFEPAWGLIPLFFWIEKKKVSHLWKIKKLKLFMFFFNSDEIVNWFGKYWMSPHQA